MPGPGNYHPENYQLPGHPNAKVGVAFQGLSPRTHNVEEAEQLSVPLPFLASLQSSLQERFYTAMGGRYVHTLFPRCIYVTSCADAPLTPL